MKYLIDLINEEIIKLKESNELANKKIVELQFSINSTNKNIEQCLKCLKILGEDQVATSSVVEGVSEQEMTTIVADIMRKNGSKDVHVKHIVKAGMKRFKSQAQVTLWMEDMIHKLGDICPWNKPIEARQVFSLRRLEYSSEKL